MSKVAEKERTVILVAIQKLEEKMDHHFEHLQSWHQQIAKEHGRLQSRINEMLAPTEKPQGRAP